MYMKKIFLTLAACCLAAAGAWAQSQVKYGLISYSQLLKTMPDYIEAQAQMKQLTQQYEQEAAYNEQNFKRQFTDFLQGQKEFPQNIMLKRQRDLQEAMEKSLAFRHTADSLLNCAREDMMRPVEERLNAAIQAVGMERGYECVVNTDGNALPFVHHSLCEDAMPYVEEKLKEK